MIQDQSNHYYRVVCSSGDVFYTKARSAIEFVLDPVFIQFMVMCVFLFSSLMLALGLPLIPQLILFGAGLVTTFFWLTISIAVYLVVVGVLGTRTFYTPILLAPALMLNTLCMNYVLGIFDTSYIGGFEGIGEFALRTCIIVICLDIFHSRFVAPQHKCTVSVTKDGRVVPLGTADTPPAPDTQPTPVEGTPQKRLAVPKAQMDPQVSENLQDAQPNPPSEPRHSVRIGREVFQIESINYVKSEDHYLIVHNGQQTDMVRGRLREVIPQIDAAWGLQINRSAWIAYAAISEVHDAAKGLTVLMNDGTTLKVANSRKMFFKHGCAQYVPKIEWKRGSQMEP